jgi:Na+/proline symporter
MSSNSPFVDASDWSYDTGRIVAEAIPIAMLIGLFGAVAFVPLSIATLVGGGSILGDLFRLLAQFVLAVGSGVVLLHVVVRGVQLADGTDTD